MHPRHKSTSIEPSGADKQFDMIKVLNFCNRKNAGFGASKTNNSQQPKPGEPTVPY
jgi:hypothetical protein